MNFKLNLTLVFLLSMIACSESGEERFEEKIQETINTYRYEDVRVELERIRQQVYRTTDLSGHSDFIIDHNKLTAEEMLKIFDANEGGVHCSGVAEVLSTAYREHGYRSYILSYGFKNALTHAVVLVEINNKLYLHDAYLNSSYRKPLFEMLDDLLGGVTTQYYLGMPEQRDIHYKSINDMLGSWTYDGDDKHKDCIYDGKKYTCRSVHTPELFFSRYNMNTTYEKLESMNLPLDFSYALLFPYGVSSFTDGYTDSFKSSKNNGWLGRIAKYVIEQSNGRINPLEVHANEL